MPHKHLDSQAEERLEVVFGKTLLQPFISLMPFSTLVILLETVKDEQTYAIPQDQIIPALDKPFPH